MAKRPAESYPTPSRSPSKKVRTLGPVGRAAALASGAVIGFIGGNLPGVVRGMALTEAALAFTFDNVPRQATIVNHDIYRSVVGKGKGPPFMKPDKSPFNLPLNKYILVV